MYNTQPITTSCTIIFQRHSRHAGRRRFTRAARHIDTHALSIQFEFTPFVAANISRQPPAAATTQHSLLADLLRRRRRRPRRVEHQRFSFPPSHPTASCFLSIQWLAYLIHSVSALSHAVIAHRYDSSRGYRR
jgi:hypothetical protein